MPAFLSPQFSLSVPNCNSKSLTIEEDNLTKQQRSIVSALDIVTKLLMNFGDVLFVVWIIQMITGFEPHSSYPFVGINGAMYILLIYLIASAIYLQEVRLRKKFQK